MYEAEDTIHTLTTSVCQMNVKEDNLIFINIFENATIEIPEVDEMYKSFTALANNEACFLIVTPGHGNTSSEEARKYAAKLKGKNVIAEALIINNLAIRLLANFYIKVNRPKQKIKIFSTTASALVWINSIKAKSSQS